MQRYVLMTRLDPSVMQDRRGRQAVEKSVKTPCGQAVSGG